MSRRLPDDNTDRRAAESPATPDDPKLEPVAKRTCDLDIARRLYAEEIRVKADLRSDALIEAFAVVPREHYLGPGPWLIKKDGRGLLHKLDERLRGEYRLTDDADPRRIYRDVHVAIDATRGLNNGRPGRLAHWLDLLDLRAGECVLHVGCGVGYYTAIMAEVTGHGGQIVGFEIDAELAERARRNLAHLGHVEVLHADGGVQDVGKCDAVFVNAGSTRVCPVWLDGLRPGGRMILPLTTNDGRGALLKVTFDGRAYAARFVSSARVFHCAGSRDSESARRLRDALRRADPAAVRSLRRDAHLEDATCWFHLQGCCLSTLPAGHEV
ncbi:MAG TPA: methyltransferase domain-containing protein [Pyrinomonadaceae bacterium]|nr:methyltransferase domain-containing protein [Pyrinomonadaceae bacterium]